MGLSIQKLPGESLQSSYLSRQLLSAMGVATVNCRERSQGMPEADKGQSEKPKLIADS
jgi:hypothetical protein